ncbi:MAG: Ig-like domain-containing protein, partial [Roseinatronobacter sp.]
IFPDDLDLTDVQGNQTLRFQVKRTSLVEVENEDEDAEPVFEEVTEVVASGSASVIIDTIPPEITIETPIAGDDVLNKAESGADLTIEGTAKGAEDGQEVTVTFNGQTFTAIVEGEAWSLTIPAADLAALDLDDGESYEITAAVSDKAGNPAEPATTTLATDFSAEITINPVVIETLNTFTGVTVTGTTTDVEAGREVTLSFNGVEYKTDVEEDGSWSVDILADVIKALDDEAEIAISATVSDVAGNADSAATSSTTDFSVPALVITSPESGGFINATTVGNPFDVSGVALAGSPVTVTLGTGETAQTQTITADENNAWTVRFDNISTLADGVLPITATTSIEGTPITAPDVTVVLDTTPPGLTLTSAVNASNALVLSGTTDTDVEQVQLQVAGQSFTADAAGGTWSLTIPALDLPPVAAGADATILANATDRAGNSAPQQTLGLAAASVTIQTPLDGTIVGLEAFENGATFSGTTTGVAEGAQVQITLTSAEDPDGLTISAVVDAAGAWSVNVPAASVQNAVDQSDYTVTASVSGSAYPAIASDEIGVSTNIPPQITLDALGEDGALILSDGNSLDVSGSTRGVQVGQTVRILDGNDTELGTAQVGADGTWNTTVQVTNLSGGQVLGVKAVVTNASGRSVDDTGSVLGYEASVFSAVYASSSGDIIDFFITTELDNVTSGGISRFQFNMEFDPTVVRLLPAELIDVEGELVASGGLHSTIALGERNPNDAPDGSTTVVGIRLLGQITNFDSEALYVFKMEDLKDDSVIEISLKDARANDIGVGPSISYTGTSGADEITAANIDTVIRGRGGDDTIDVSAPGVNTIIFEPNFAANGEDTIIGFSTSGALADRIAIADLENGTLRGDGTQFELLDAGDAAGANTGLIVFKTSLDTDEDGIAALDSLGLGADDIVYIIVGDDADSELVRIVVNSDGSFPDLDDIEVLARFEGMGEEQRAEFGAANFINFDPVPSAPLVAILSEV